MLQEIVKQFFPEDEVASIETFGKGHINTTYKLDLIGNGDSYILQRINTDVFKNPHGIAETHQRLQEEFSGKDHPVVIAELIPTADGKSLYEDGDAGVWRMTSFIEGSQTKEVVKEPWEAEEAGSAFGWFARACSHMDPASFKEAIKDFHRLSFRISQLDEAIEADSAGRLESARDVVDFFKERQATFSQIEAMVDEGKIPVRIVHNDTKINNVLFREQQAVAVIDLDTVGPGILYYDYGDALRTSASTAEEDEKGPEQNGI
jgi:N-acetylhexosamine 1-kinase